MAFTTNMTAVAQLDDSLVLDFDTQFLIASAQQGVMEQFATIKKEIGAKSIQISKYSQMALATSTLDEDDDVTSVAMADSAITLTPAEYGAVVTRTQLASLQTGGKADLAAARLVGINLGRTQDALAVAALEASANSLTVDGGAESSLDATDVMSVTFLNQLYNKLARASVEPMEGGLYVAVLHDDVIYDLRASAAAGSWQDINKYSNAVPVLKNEVGMLGGFRIVRNNHCAITDGGGASTVDTYKSSFFGMNALGKAVSKEPAGVLSGPFDKLGRFVNVGWYGCFQYKIIDSDAAWVGITASSIGANS